MAIAPATVQRPQHPAQGFAFPAPRYPDYIRQPRATTVEELLPLARVHIGRRYAFPALGPVNKGDHILIMTYTKQDPLVLDAARQAMVEAGAQQVDALTWSDLGVRDPVQRWSAADGWRECVEPIGPMIEDGVEYKVEATALRGFLEKHPEYTAFYAGEAGGNHWRRTTSRERYRGNWLFSTYENFISRCSAYPDEIWRLIDRKLLTQFRRAAAVHITDPQGTDVSWDVTDEEAALWVKTATVPGHMLASTIQGIRRATPVSELLRFHQRHYPTLNGVVSGTANHSGYYPHIRVHMERGMVVKIEGDGRYAELFREVVERFKDAEYPGFPYKGWAYFNDCTIGTNPKGIRNREGLWDYGDRQVNLAERLRAGVIHWGWGAEHWDQSFIEYARERHLPIMHFPHVHNYLSDYAIKDRASGEWFKVIDQGRLTVLDDPDVIRVASLYGDPAHILDYDWIPTLPGINFAGNYATDYAPDPVAWIRRDVDGEFAGDPTTWAP
jgi:hypothetical protein